MMQMTSRLRMSEMGETLDLIRSRGFSPGCPLATPGEILEGPILRPGTTPMISESLEVGSGISISILKIFLGKAMFSQD